MIAVTHFLFNCKYISNSSKSISNPKSWVKVFVESIQMDLLITFCTYNSHKQNQKATNDPKINDFEKINKLLKADVVLSILSVSLFLTFDFATIGVSW